MSVHENDASSPVADPLSSAAARRALGDFADGRVSKEMVMRALVEHDGWFVPMWYLQLFFAPEPIFVDKALGFAAQFEYRPDRLWLFTDEDAARAANDAFGGEAVGLVGGPIDGVELFRTLVDGAAAIDVNPGSATRETWLIGADAFELTRLWARAVELERKLKRLADLQPGAPDYPRALAEATSRLVGYSGYLVLAWRDGNTVVRLQGSAGVIAMIFTTPENVEPFLAHSNPDEVAAWRTVGVPGDRLFEQMATWGVDGFSVNSMHGPGFSLTLGIGVLKLVEMLKGVTTDVTG
jgi:hypothetical protein